MKNQLMALIIGFVVACIGGWYLDYLLRDEIIKVARLVIYALASLLLLTVVGLLVFFGLIFSERFRKVRASRQEAERNAQVMVVRADEGQQVYIRDTGAIPWRNAHLDTRVYADNQVLEPSEDEIRLWQMYQLRHRPSSSQASQLPLLPEPPQVDILDVLDQAQCALIVGQRDAGKTTILQHVISRRLSRSQVLVLDPHSHPTRWPQGAQVIGAERNFPKIAMALQGLEALMNKRYRDIGKGLVAPGEHTRVTVIIDEWRAIVLNLGKTAADIIKALLAESRETNIDMFVGTHSERVKALGIEGEGDLKEGFVMVRLTINKMSQERRGTVDYGDGEIPGLLPGPFVSQDTKAIDSGELIDLQPEPTSQEAKILDMHKVGKSLRDITKAVFNGKFGDFYNDKVRDVLEKFDEK